MKQIDKSTHAYVNTKGVLEYHFISMIQNNGYVTDSKLTIMPIEGIFEMKSQYAAFKQPELMYLIHYK